MQQRASVFLVFLVLVVAFVPAFVFGHGMMLNPPQRSSMFRFGYSVPPNYNDNSLNCGGFGVIHLLVCLMFPLILMH